MSPKIQVEVSVLDKISNEVAQINQNLSGFARNIESSFSSLSKGFVAVAAIGGIVASVKSAVDQSLELASSITKSSEAFGVSTDTIQKWRYVAQQSNADASALDRAMAQMSKGVFQSGANTGQVSKAFDRLHISMTDSNGAIKTTDDLFKETMFAIAGIQSPLERAAMAQAVFGKGGRELLPILSQGKDAIEAMLNQADAFGQVLSKEMIDKLNSANVTIEAMDTSMKNATATIVSAAAPLLKEWSKGMTEVVSQWSTGLTEILGGNENKSIGALTKELEKQKIRLTELNNQLAHGWLGGILRDTPDVKRQIGEVTNNIYGLQLAIDAVNKPSKSGMGGTGIAEEEIKAMASATKLAEDARIKLIVDSQEREIAVVNLKYDELAKKNAEYTKVVKEQEMARGIEIAAIRQKYEMEADTALKKEADKYLDDAGKAQKKSADLNITLQKEILQAQAVDLQGKLALLDYEYHEELNNTELTEYQKYLIWKKYSELEGKDVTENDTKTSKAQQATLKETAKFTFDTMDQIFQKNKDDAVGFKILSVARAGMNAYEAASSFLTAKPPGPWNFVEAGVALAAGLADAASIAGVSFASGTGFGWSRVGEQGPENVFMPAGAQVMNAIQTHNTENNTTTSSTNLTIHLHGAISETIRAELRQGAGDRLVADLRQKFGI